MSPPCGLSTLLPISSHSIPCLQGLAAGAALTPSPFSHLRERMRSSLISYMAKYIRIFSLCGSCSPWTHTLTKQFNGFLGCFLIQIGRPVWFELLPWDNGIATNLHIFGITKRTLQLCVYHVLYLCPTVDYRLSLPPWYDSLLFWELHLN